jgi:NitT/TauT family transport system permease protein
LKIMSSPRAVSFVRGAVGLAVLVAAWEMLSRSAIGVPALTPRVEDIGLALLRMLRDGTLARHLGFTLYRLAVGFLLAVVIGVPLGLLIGRSRVIERLLVPILSVFMPIPSLAWVPLFLLWFGLGDGTTFIIVFYAALFPMIFNTWSGVRGMNVLWLRAASAMGASGRVVFWKVVFPGSMAFVIAGLRQSFARAWTAVVGAEMFAATAWGLGWVVFDSGEFLNADVMMAVLLVIGLVGLVFERYVFGWIERSTVVRWGMMQSTRR